MVTTNDPRPATVCPRRESTRWSLTVTALAGNEGRGGWVTALPGGASLPVASNVNTNGLGDIRPNLVVVPLGADGSIDLHLFQMNDVVVDVTGYFTDGTATASTSGRFRSTSPYREVDTRTPFGFDGFAGRGQSQVSTPSWCPRVPSASRTTWSS